MRAALRHVYPAWQDDPHAEDSAGESKLVWSGRMRIVRSAKRMHQLKRRGVPIMHLGYGDGTAAQQTRSELGNLVPQGPWAWFVEEANPTRDVQQFLKRRARAKARRAERLREMFRAQLADPHVLGLVITPFIHALDARPRRHWQDEPLPISGWNEFGTERPSRIDYTPRNIQLELYASIVGPRLAGQIVDGTPEVSPEEDAAARMYFLPRPAKRSRSNTLRGLPLVPHAATDQPVRACVLRDV